MQISARMNIPDGETVSHRRALCHWFVPLLGCAVCALQGCSVPPAPSPTPNPNPQHTLKLKVTVEKGSEVNRVVVESEWVVTNLNCAPLVWPAGNRRVKQVDVPEKVEKNGNYYVTTIVLDTFKSGKCRWVNTGPVIKFFRNDYRLASWGVTADSFHGRKVDKMTCLTRPFNLAGTCGLRDEESWYKSEDKNAFNASVELMK